MISGEQLQIVAYWPGYSTDNETGDTLCRSCGEGDGLPTGDAMSCYRLTEELLELWEDRGDDAILCDYCGAVIVELEIPLPGWAC